MTGWLLLFLVVAYVATYVAEIITIIWRHYHA